MLRQFKEEKAKDLRLLKQPTMAIKGPNEAPKTSTTIKPSLNKCKGEKSQIFTPKIISCLSANNGKQKQKKLQEK